MCKRAENRESYSYCYTILYQINMPDPIRKRFGYGQLWPLRPACSQNRAGSYMPDPTSCIRFSSFFQRRHGSYCAKPTRIRSGWPGQSLAKRFWSGSKPVCRNHLARFLAGRKRSATSFLLSDSVPFFGPQTSRIILCKTSLSGSDSVLADCVRFGPN